MNKTKEPAPDSKDSFIPTACVLAVKDDRIIGEIRANKDMIAVLKDGQLTEQKRMVSFIPLYWQFPQK